MTRITALLCAGLLATSVSAEEKPILDYSATSSYISFFSEKETSGVTKIVGFYFTPQMAAWCVVEEGAYNGGFKGCLPEYQIPPARLRELRAAAGLEVEAPVWNGARGEFVPLPPSE